MENAWQRQNEDLAVGIRRWNRSLTVISIGAKMMEKSGRDQDKKSGKRTRGILSGDRSWACGVAEMRGGSGEGDKGCI